MKHQWKEFNERGNSNPKDFQREYLGLPFLPSAQEVQLRKLAESYIEITEAFDQLHCAARNEYGEAIPVTGEES